MAVMIKQLFVCKNCGMGVSAQTTPSHCLKCKHKFDSDLDKTALFWPESPLAQSSTHTEFESEEALNKNEERTSDVNPAGPIKAKIVQANSKKYLKFMLSTDATAIKNLLVSIEDLYRAAHGIADKDLLLLLISHSARLKAQSDKLEAIRDSGSELIDYQKLYS